MAVEMNTTEAESLNEIARLKTKNKWLLGILVLVTILALFFMYQMVIREQLVKTYHQSALRTTGYYINRAKSDVKAAVGSDDESKIDHLNSARDKLGFAMDDMRSFAPIFNFRGSNMVYGIGNGAAREFFNYYIYTINDWVWDLEEEGIPIEDELLLTLIDDLELIDATFTEHNMPQNNKKMLVDMDYDEFEALFIEIIKNSKTSFTYESMWFE